MKCPSCGREVPYGQKQCLCGTTVSGGYDTMYDNDLNLNPRRPNVAPALIAIILVLILVGVAAWMLFIAPSYNITHESAWDTLYTDEYQITVPKGLHQRDVTVEPGTVALDARGNNEVLIGITAIRLSADEQKIVANTAFLQDLLIEFFPKEDDEAGTLDPQKRGRMIYVEFPADRPGEFLGSDRVHLVDAIFVGKTAFYEIEIHCPEDKYEKYEESIFAWLDSFHPKEQ